jgi:hypothetical protein
VGRKTKRRGRGWLAGDLLRRCERSSCHRRRSQREVESFRCRPAVELTLPHDAAQPPPRCEEGRRGRRHPSLASSIAPSRRRFPLHCVGRSLVTSSASQRDIDCGGPPSCANHPPPRRWCWPRWQPKQKPPPTLRDRTSPPLPMFVLTMGRVRRRQRSHADEGRGATSPSPFGSRGSGDAVVGSSWRWWQGHVYRRPYRRAALGDEVEGKCAAKHWGGKLARGRVVWLPHG